MAEIANEDFLSELKAQYPPTPLDGESAPSAYVKNPWYIVAAIAFSASNCPEAVPLLLKYVLGDLDKISASPVDRLNVVRRMRDGVFKSGMICGFPKVMVIFVQ